MRLVVYCRQSNKLHEHSLEAQEAEVKAWAKREGHVVVSVHGDKCSGATPIDERLGLKGTLADVFDKDLNVEGLAVFRRDRISRIVLLSAMVDKLCADRGVVVLSATEPAASGDQPENALIRTILDAVAEYERALSSIRTTIALRVAKGKGVRLGRPASMAGPRTRALVLQLKAELGWAPSRISRELAQRYGIKAGRQAISAYLSQHYAGELEDARGKEGSRRERAGEGGVEDRAAGVGESDSAGVQ